MGPHVGPHVEPHRPSGFASFDSALKEAVRRSLQDAAPKEEAILDETQVVDTEETAEEEIIVPVDASPLEEFKDAPEEEEIAIEAESLVHNPVPVPLAPVEDAPASVSAHSPLIFSPNVDPETAEEEIIVPVDAFPLEEFKNAPEEEDIAIEAGSLVHNPAPVPSAPVEDAPASVSAHSSLKIFPNVDPVLDDDGCFDDDETEDDKAAEKPVVIERDTAIASERSEADVSFASDAVGSGDIAEAMGATLDMVAGVISEILSEADAHNKPAASKKETPLVSETSGAMILESTDDTKQDDEHSESDTENDWHVVGSDDESLKQDEEIARAAGMLGSALFNSDMRSSDEIMPNSDTRYPGEAVSALSHSQGSYAESFSVASVPSTVPSIAHSWQVDASHRDRWSTQLSQLRELGFDDESLCVEIIERLNAANIGCDADEEISVTQVVDALLTNN